MRSLECAALRDAISERSHSSTPPSRYPAVCQYMNPNKIREAAPNRPRNSNASRKLVVRGMSLRATENITRAPNRVDQLRQSTFLKLAAQPAATDIDHI